MIFHNFKPKNILIRIRKNSKKTDKEEKTLSEKSHDLIQNTTNKAI